VRIRTFKKKKRTEKTDEEKQNDRKTVKGGGKGKTGRWIRGRR
jgi:hypothetical protein